LPGRPADNERHAATRAPGMGRFYFEEGKGLEIEADAQLDYLRVPPHSIEAEQSVLGGLLLDNAAFDRVADVLTEDDFYRFDHRLIWQHIARLVALARPADVVTVHESLATAGKA